LKKAPVYFIFYSFNEFGFDNLFFWKKR